jgi:hypothetical protein
VTNVQSPEAPRRSGRRRWIVAAAVTAVAVIYAALMAVLVFIRSPGDAVTQTDAVIYAVGSADGSLNQAASVARMLGDHRFDALLTLGDLAPPDGSTIAYEGAYRPVFGRFDKQVKPTPGDLDYRTPSASGYYSYFSNHAVAFKAVPYYSFALAGWRIFSLDSQQADLTPASDMYRWLRDALGEATEPCVAAYWHTSKPSGPKVDPAGMSYVRALLGAYGADVVLSADADTYSHATASDGVTSFVVGTASGLSGSSPTTGGSGANASAAGALQLTLNPGSAQYAFHTTDDTISDSGHITCHGRHAAPSAEPGAPQALVAKPGPTGIALSWKPGAGTEPIIGYLVLRSGERIGFTQALTFRDTTLPRGASVLYTVRAVSAAGVPSPDSDAAHSGGKSPGYTDYSWTLVESNPVTPTADKPQSKLWRYADTWWGLLWGNDPANPRHSSYYIQRFDPKTQAWTNTGVAVDDRNRSHADALWVESTKTLYVVSTIGSGGIKLYRYSWTGSTYALDPGFPNRLTDDGSESVTIARDSKGILWVTITQRPGGLGPCVPGAQCIVRVMHSTTADWRWTAPVQLPVQESVVQPDDISTIVAFGGKAIGVAWGNQLVGGTFFAIHVDGTPDSVWNLETVFKLPRGSDDHLNVKADSAGRVYLIFKTSLNDPLNKKLSDPLMILAVREANGQWRQSPVWTVRDDVTRAQILIDESAGRIYAFAAANAEGGAIYVKSALTSTLAFKPGLGSVLMAVGRINNATTTKQTVRLADGILILASEPDTHTYWHAYITPQMPTP